MKVFELTEYLNGFKEDDEVVVLIADPKKRVRYEVQKTLVLTDAGLPVICLEVGSKIDFDVEEIKAAEACEKGADNGQ